VIVRVTALWKVSEQEPEGATPAQLSPVEAVTVTVPEGVSVSPACGTTEKLTVTGWPTSAVLGATEMLVDVVAWTPVPLSATDWVAPLVPPLSSVKVRVPVKPPTDVGAKETSSEQLVPAAIGEAFTQFWLEAKLADAATAVTCKGALPLLVSVTV
jgi:hypothetical protein